MSLSLIQIVLGTSFVLIWIFIGAMIFRDGRFAIREERESQLYRAHSGHTGLAGNHQKLARSRARGQNRRRSSAA